MEQIKLYAQITKIDPEERIVEGYASTEALDSQGEIVTREAIEGALADYMKFANIREMHQPKVAGKTKYAELDDKGLYIKVKVVADDAWKLVKEGAYTGFSIGGMANAKVGNRITSMKLKEISLVDRPANTESIFTLVKMDDAGNFINFNQTNMAKAKKEEIVVEDTKQDEKVEETPTPVEEATEEVSQEAEVVVDEVKEQGDFQTDVMKMLNDLNTKLDNLSKVEATEKMEKSEDANVISKVDELSKQIADLKENYARPIKAQASYVVSKNESDNEVNKYELREKLDANIAKLDACRVTGQKPSDDLVKQTQDLQRKLGLI